MQNDAEQTLTVGDLKRELQNWTDDTEIVFGGTIAGADPSFCRFKMRGEKVLQIELNENFPAPGTYSVTIPE